MERDFDDKIKELYDAGAFAYKPENWDKLKEKLTLTNEINHSKKLIGFLGFLSIKKILAAASVLFLMGLSITYYITKSENEKNSVSNGIGETQGKENLISITKINKDSLQLIKPIAKINSVQHQSSKSNLNKVPFLNHRSNSKLSKAYPLNPKTSTDLNEIIAESSTVVKKTLSNTVAKEEASHQDLIPSKKSEPIVKSRPQNKPLIETFAVLPKENEMGKADGLSIIGSFGKGLNNSVYAAGINYQIGISKRFFVEGAISVFSSNIQNVVSFSNANEEKLNTTTNGNGTLAVALLDEANNNLKIQNANYAHLTINPSLGFKVSNRLSFKTGIDMQKKISNSNELSYAESSSEFKQLPNIDIGITPKIGIDLNNHWQTNLIYRKAINDLIYKKVYYNRNYVQIQLGYKF